MTKLMIQEHNSATGEIIEREMTAEEIAIHEAGIIEKQAQDALANSAKASAEAKLTALGLTTDDLKALGLGTN